MTGRSRGSWRARGEKFTGLRSIAVEMSRDRDNHQCDIFLDADHQSFRIETLAGILDISLFHLHRHTTTRSAFSRPQHYSFESLVSGSYHCSVPFTQPCIPLQGSGESTPFHSSRSGLSSTERNTGSRRVSFLTRSFYARHSREILPHRASFIVLQTWF